MKRIAGAAVILLMLAGCGKGEEPAAAPSSTTTPALTVNGNLQLSTTSLGGGTYEELTNGSAHCYGTDGYDDIKEGAQVTVTDEASKVVGVGSLEPGNYFGGDCNFKFTVENVAPGRPFYGIEVSRRGVVRFEGNKVATPNLSLGS